MDQFAACEDVLDQMANNPKVCRYMDIPLQHISDKVLDNMHRHVTGAWTRELITKMRERVPGVVLRTTMIVGHPGEGKRDFNELLEFAEQICPLSYHSGIFIYFAD